MKKRNAYKQYRTADPRTLPTDADAQIFGEFLDENFPEGAPTNEVVKLAKSRNCPIHNYFDWNDTSAANKYRLQQARQMINSIVVIVEDVETRAYQSVFVEEVGRRYVSTESARQAPSLWKQVLDDALEEARSWKARYEQYKQLGPIIRAISKLEKEKPWQPKRKQSKRPLQRRKKKKA